MREYLTLLIDSDQFEDNAAPGFLVNPLTNERMQFDRFYPPSVAFEFQGPQHYGATALYSEAEAAKQRGRDLMKQGICIERGIRLVLIQPQDLSLKVIQQKVGPLLPLRDLIEYQPLIAMLESIARGYRRKAKREGASREPA